MGLADCTDSVVKELQYFHDRCHGKRWCVWSIPWQYPSNAKNLGNEQKGKMAIDGGMVSRHAISFSRLVPLAP